MNLHLYTGDVCHCGHLLKVADTLSESPGSCLECRQEALRDAEKLESLEALFRNFGHLSTEAKTAAGAAVIEPHGKFGEPWASGQDVARGNGTGSAGKPWQPGETGSIKIPPVVPLAVSESAARGQVAENPQTSIDGDDRRIDGTANLHPAGPAIDGQQPNSRVRDLVGCDGSGGAGGSVLSMTRQISPRGHGGCDAASAFLAQDIQPARQVQPDEVGQGASVGALTDFDNGTGVENGKPAQGPCASELLHAVVEHGSGGVESGHAYCPAYHVKYADSGWPSASESSASYTFRIAGDRTNTP